LVKPEFGVAFKRHVDDGLPILPLLLEGVAPERVPPFLSLKLARSLPADLTSFDFARLAAELHAVSGPTVSPVSKVPPFPGLPPLEEEAADYFLGRHADTLALLERLGRGVDGIQRRWLQVEGPHQRRGLIVAGPCRADSRRPGGLGLSTFPFWGWVKVGRAA
jgi:hypothetical protein